MRPRAGGRAEALGSAVSDAALSRLGRRSRGPLNAAGTRRLGGRGCCVAKQRLRKTRVKSPQHSSSSSCRTCVILFSERHDV